MQIDDLAIGDRWRMQILDLRVDLRQMIHVDHQSIPPFINPQSATFVNRPIFNHQ
jgi:hypothetical protein